MTLKVPLAVRIGDQHVTAKVSGLQFRKEAVGGVRSINLNLSAPLDSFPLSIFDKVWVYDGRSAASIAEGYVSDPGRTAGPDGLGWSVTCFGPAQHAADNALPLIYVDTSLDSFKRDGGYSTKGAKTTQDERTEDTPTLVVAADEGKSVTTAWQGAFISRRLKSAGMKLARVKAAVDAGITNGSYTMELRTRPGEASIGTQVASTTASTSASNLSGVVVTNFNNGHDRMMLRVTRITSTRTATEDDWFQFFSVVQRGLLLDASGSEITSGYTANTVLPHEVVNDLLGRVLIEYDGSTASVDTSATYTIDQMSYPDGITPEDVLSDVMGLVPTHYWTTGPANASGKATFAWRPWPTTVRYEATLEDGGDFPVSSQECVNKVTVRYQDPHDKTRAQVRTSADAGVTGALDKAGKVRSLILDAGDEVGSAASAIKFADNYLAAHAYPANAGTLTVARPIRDLVKGGMAEPFELEPGELIRVRGVESYPDALNASSNDGQTVFRIWAVTYDSDTNSASLELDTYPRTTAAALARLMKRRRRKR